MQSGASDSDSAIEPLNKDHNVSAFDCGKELLNRWLREMAWQKQKYHSTRTFVVLREARVVGYFALVFGAVGRESMPGRVARGVAKEHQVPILLLARLAVCQSARGTGLGAVLLRDAIRKTALAASVGGLRALLVDAMDEEAKGFYLKYGFHPCPLQGMQLFLTIDDVLEAVARVEPDFAHPEVTAPGPAADIQTLCLELDKLRAEAGTAENAGDQRLFDELVAQQRAVLQKVGLLCEAEDLVREQATGKKRDPDPNDYPTMVLDDGTEYKVLRSWDVGREFYVHHDIGDAALTLLKGLHSGFFRKGTHCHFLIRCWEHKDLVAAYHRNPSTGIDEFTIQPLEHPEYRTWGRCRNEQGGLGEIEVPNN